MTSRLVDGSASRRGGRGTEKFACRTLSSKRDVLTKQSLSLPDIASPTRKAKFADKHARDLYRGIQKRDARKIRRSDDWLLHLNPHIHFIIETLCRRIWRRFDQIKSSSMSTSSRYRCSRFGFARSVISISVNIFAAKFRTGIDTMLANYNNYH